jgi:PmbA protein
VSDAAGARELAERACRSAAGDEVEAVVHSERSGFARFAGSTVHQPTLVEDRSVTIRVVRDGRVGTVATNRTDDDGLMSAARRAADAAENARPDPGFPGLALPAETPAVTAFDPETAELTPDEQARRAWAAIEAAPRHGLYGYFTSGVAELAVASSTGVSVAQAMTDASVVALAARDGESGYADATSWRAAVIDPAEMGRTAAERAERTRGAGEVEPGTYRAVLEPYAFGELVWYFGFSSLGGLAFLEGRSYLSGRIGERVFHPDFTLLDDASDERGLPKAFDFEGVPKQRVTLVDRGVARGVVWDRRTGRRAGTESTGHALAAPAQTYGPIPFNLVVPGGDAATDELVERVEDGIYVTRLHYVNLVDAREGIFTGMTRDGTFRIEGGRVTRPLVNLRFTTSFPDLVARLIGLSREPRLVNQNDFYGERYPYGTLVPAVATEAFTVTGTGSAPGV